jgi:hypothetical protein
MRGTWVSWYARVQVDNKLYVALGRNGPRSGRTERHLYYRIAISRKILFIVHFAHNSYFSLPKEQLLNTVVILVLLAPSSNLHFYFTK